jgi:hypothetical protein
MKIEQYTRKELREKLGTSVRFREQFLIPEERVLAQTANPRATDNDVVLFLGREEGKVIGSLGVVPDMLFADGEPKKIGWLNHWNGASEKRHAGIGALLFLTAMNSYKNSIGVSGFTEAARRVYEGSNRFVVLKQKEGASVFIRIDLTHLLPRRFPILGSVHPIFRIADKLMNIPFNLRLNRWHARQCENRDYYTRQVEQIDQETAIFISQVRSKELFLRGADELNWIKKYNWDDQNRDQRFFINIHEASGKIVGFVFLKVVNESMTVPYYFCRDQHFDLVLRTIGQHLVTLGASSLLTYDSSIVQGLRRLEFPMLYERTRQKTFLISKLYASLGLSDYYVHDGDGDAFV